MQPPAPTLCFAHPPLRAPPASTASLTLSSAHPRLRPPSHPLLPPSDPLTLSSAPPTLRSAHRPPPQLRSAHALFSSAHPSLRAPPTPAASLTLTLCSAHSHALLRSPSAPQAPLTLRPRCPANPHALFRPPSRSAPLTLRSAHSVLRAVEAQGWRSGGDNITYSYQRIPSVPSTALTFSSAHPLLHCTHPLLRSPSRSSPPTLAPLNLTLRSQGQCWCTGRRGHAQVTTTCALL